MNKKNIIYLCHNGKISGGAQKSILILLRKINKNIYKPLVICPEKGSFTDVLSMSGIDWEVAPSLKLSVGKTKNFIDFIKMWGKYFLGTLKILFLLKKYDADIVHTNTIFPLSGAIAAKILNIPHIWHVREVISSPFYNFIISRTLIRKIINFLSSEIIFVSNYVRQEINLNTNTLQSKGTVIYNAVDLEEYKINSKNIGDKVIIGTVGNIHPIKQQHKIPSIIKEIILKNKDVKFEWHLYGNVSGGAEEYFRKIKENIKQHKLEKFCKIKGFRSQKKFIRK